MASVDDTRLSSVAAGINEGGAALAAFFLSVRVFSHFWGSDRLGTFCSGFLPVRFKDGNRSKGLLGKIRQQACNLINFITLD